MRRILAVVLAAALASPGCAARSAALMRVAAPSAQAPAGDQTTIEAWQSFVSKLPPGARLTLTLKNGRHVRGTLLQSTADTLVVAPRTRIPEPVQTVRYTDLAALDLEREGTSVARAVGIGVASGVGAFLTILMALIASFD